MYCCYRNYLPQYPYIPWGTYNFQNYCPPYYCPYKNQLMPAPYIYNPDEFNYGMYFPWNPVNTFQNLVIRDEPGMEEPPPEEMAGSGQKPNYIPKEPSGGPYRPIQIENILINCESGSGWVYIWTVEETEFWAKVISHEDQKYVNLEGYGPVSFNRIRKIVCHDLISELPPVEGEGVDEGEFVMAKHFPDYNIRNGGPAKIQMPYSPSLNPFYPYNPNYTGY